MHHNANYTTRKDEAQKHVQYAKTSGPKSICIYSLIIHLEISIQNNSLVLSCEPHPKCKPKATDNCINNLCLRSTILATAVTSTIVFSLVENNTSPSLMFLSLQLDIGGHEPTIMHKAPSWITNLLL